MKKIIVCLLLFFISIGYIKAETFYSDYGEFSSFSEEYINSSDTTYVDSQRRYKIYKEIYDNGDYYIENKNPITLPYINKNDYIEDYSKWTKNNPKDELNRVVQEKLVYEYSDMKKIRYIHLYNFHGSYGSFRISELEVYSNDTKINFTYYCEGCNSEFDNYITNGNPYENKSHLANGDSYLRIDLGTYYDLSSITLRTYLFDVGYDVKSYSVRYTRDLDFNSNIYAEAYLEYYFSYDKCIETVPFDTNIDNYSIVNPEWNNSIISDDKIEQTKTRRVDSYIMYRYKDIKYRYFNYEKIYKDGYYINPDDDYPLLDETNYKDFYRYKTRDKVVINDNLQINSYNFDLNNFIEESTLSDFNISHNIDYSKNSLYDITFEFSFISINKKVNVFIFENDYLSLEEKIKEINELFCNLINNNSLTEKQLNDVLLLQNNGSEKLKIYEKKIKDLNKQLLDLEKENDNHEQDNQGLKEKINLLDKEKKELNNYVEELKKQISDLNNEINNNLLTINQLYKEFKESLLNEESLSKSNKELQKLYEDTLNEKIKILDDMNNYKIKIDNMHDLVRNSSIKIVMQEQTINALNMQNKELNKIISDYKLDINKNNNELKEYENRVKDLLKQIDLLNEKINNQNYDIDFLVKTNNTNNAKYINEIERLKILLKNEKENRSLKENDLNVCLDSEKEYLLDKNYSEKRALYKNIIFYTTSLLAIIICFIIYKIKKL